MLPRVFIVIVLALVAVPTRGDDSDRIGQLSQVLSQHPGDVDTRLQLALEYARCGDRAAARRHAEQVVREAPKYADAHMLVARLDAWDGRYAEARARAETLLPSYPDRHSVLELLLDVAIWSHQLKDARQLANQLLELSDSVSSANIYYRLASIDLEEMHGWSAYRRARAAAAIDPSLAAAVQLKQDIVLASADLFEEFSVFPSLPSNMRTGHVVTAGGTVLPRSFLSLRLQNEYVRRFATDNNRVTLGADWRITRRVEIGATGSVGLPAHVIPKYQFGAQAHFPLGDHFSGAVGYNFLPPSWGGRFNQVRLELNSYLPWHLRLDAAYLAGLLQRCGGVDNLHTFMGSVVWDREPLLIGASYWYGAELDRPAIPDANSALYTSEGCPKDVGTTTLAKPFPITELLGHTVGGKVSYRLNHWLSFGGGYSILMRLQGSKIHTGSFGARFDF